MRVELLEMPETNKLGMTKQQVFENQFPYIKFRNDSAFEKANSLGRSLYLVTKTSPPKHWNPAFVTYLEDGRKFFGFRLLSFKSIESSGDLLRIDGYIVQNRTQLSSIHFTDVDNTKGAEFDLEKIRIALARKRIQRQVKKWLESPVYSNGHVGFYARMGFQWARETIGQKHLEHSDHSDHSSLL